MFEIVLLMQVFFKVPKSALCGDLVNYPEICGNRRSGIFIFFFEN